jgi:DNA polymerase V
MQTTIIVKGDSMNGIGIYEGDELLVDRSIEAKHGNIVLAVFNNDYTVSCAGPGQGAGQAQAQAVATPKQSNKHIPISQLWLNMESMRRCFLPLHQHC